MKTVELPIELLRDIREARLNAMSEDGFQNEDEDFLIEIAVATVVLKWLENNSLLKNKISSVS